MILAHRIHLDPTTRQRRYFAQACGTARLVWNWAMAEWNEQFRAGGKPLAMGNHRETAVVEAGTTTERTNIRSRHR